MEQLPRSDAFIIFSEELPNGWLEAMRQCLYVSRARRALQPSPCLALALLLCSVAESTKQLNPLRGWRYYEFSKSNNWLGVRPYLELREHLPCKCEGKRVDHLSTASDVSLSCSGEGCTLKKLGETTIGSVSPMERSKLMYDEEG